MTNVRRPGRAQKIAYDDTPLNARKLDVDARVGWLLAMSRLHHDDPEISDGRRFVAALGEAGVQASRSLLSRWESGEIPISYDGLSAYERVLGLAPGRLSSVTGYIRAAMPGVRARVARPHLDPASREFATRLDELIERAEEGEACAADWQDLGWHLAAVPLIHLRAGTWTALCRRLVNTLPRTVDVTYRQYSAAVMHIAGVPRAQHFLTEAVAEYVATPGVQVLNDPLAVLDRLPTRKAARMVLDLIERPPHDGVFSLAVWVAAQKVARGDFTPEERTRLDMLVLRLWRANPRKTAEGLAELIASLPEGMRSTLTDAAVKLGRNQIWHAVEYGEDLGPGIARGLSEELAEETRSRAPGDPSYGENRMLVRLVREALFHRDSDRRHIAALLLTASPFGTTLADELISLLGAPNAPKLVRSRAATLVRYLSTDAHRLRILGFLEDPDESVGATLVQGLGHMSFTPFSDQAIRTSLKEEWSRREQAKMYALGMSGSPALEAIVRSANAPEWQRTAAAWWVSQGPAVRA